MSKEEKFKLIATLGKSLDKTYGGTTFQRQGDRVNKPVPSIPTNLLSVDLDVFGCGGFPKGRIVECFGVESGGKTALCLHTIGQCQKAGGVCAFIDAEHSLSPTFASNLGVNMEELVISQPDYGEQALEIVEGLIDSKAVDLIVIDSVTALVPRAELAGEMGDSFMGLQARLLSQACRKLCGKAENAGICVIFINQVREKIGLVFGNPEVTTGGRALKFWSSLRVEVRRVAGSKGGALKEGETIVGHKVNIKAVKNKVAMPFRECVVDLNYSTGFDIAEDTIEFALKNNLLTGTAWLSILGQKEKYRREDLLDGEPRALLLAAIKKFREGK